MKFAKKYSATPQTTSRKFYSTKQQLFSLQLGSDSSPVVSPTLPTIPISPRYYYAVAQQQSPRKPQLNVRSQLLLRRANFLRNYQSKGHTSFAPELRCAKSPPPRRNPVIELPRRYDAMQISTVRMDGRVLSCDSRKGPGLTVRPREEGRFHRTSEGTQVHFDPEICPARRFTSRPGEQGRRAYIPSVKTLVLE